MEKVKAAVDPNPFVENLGGGLSRRIGLVDFLVYHGKGDEGLRG